MSLLTWSQKSPEDGVPTGPGRDRGRCRKVYGEELPRGVRRIGGHDAFVARPWILWDRGPRARTGGNGINVNLGVFCSGEYGNDRGATIAAASRAVERFLAVYYAVPDPPDPWAVVKRLQGERRFGRPVVREDVLPHWVYRRPDGLYAARRRAPGRVDDLPGPYPTPEAAHLAMRVVAGWGTGAAGGRAAGGGAEDQSVTSPRSTALLPPTDRR